LFPQSSPLQTCARQMPAGEPSKSNLFLPPIELHQDMQGGGLCFRCSDGLGLYAQDLGEIFPRPRVYFFHGLDVQSNAAGIIPSDSERGQMFPVYQSMWLSIAMKRDGVRG
jgi:hypothetical protein